VVSPVRTPKMLLVEVSGNHTWNCTLLTPSGQSRQHDAPSNIHEKEQMGL
jgi:hypothetical protein